MFSFPPLLSGDPYRENWYQDLLDNEACRNDPVKIQEAYESSRSRLLVQASSDLQQFADTLPTSVGPNSEKQPPYAKLTLLQPSRTEPPNHVRLHEAGIDPNDTRHLPVNCMCIWARPNKHITGVICDYQRRLQQHLGEALYPISTSHLHLSVVEFSHRHEQSFLKMYSSSSDPNSCNECLISRAGVALTFVPDTGRHSNSMDHPMTYHHLRNELHKLALSTGTHIDTCYTAATAHVTIARFVRPLFSHDAWGLEKARAYLRLIEEINDELEQTMWPIMAWDLAEGPGLELQMGYLKFGMERSLAKMVGRSSKVE